MKVKGAIEIEGDKSVLCVWIDDEIYLRETRYGSEIDMDEMCEWLRGIMRYALYEYEEE